MRQQSFAHALYSVATIDHKITGMGLFGQVESLVIQECASCSVDTIVEPTSPALAALPGLSRLQKFANFFNTNSNPLGDLSFKGTAFNNLTSFSGLRCIAGVIQLTNNALLRSLAGFDNVLEANFLPGPVFLARGNPLLDYKSVSPLKVLAGCTGTPTSPLSSNVFIITSVCVLPVSWHFPVIMHESFPE